MREEQELIAVWTGSTQGPNRGYLCTVADPIRQPSKFDVLEDWNPPNRRPAFSMRKRVEIALDGHWMTSKQLQVSCEGSVYGIAVVLQWLKRSGRLEQERVTRELFDLPDRRGRFRYRLKAQKAA